MLVRKRPFDKTKSIAFLRHGFSTQNLLDNQLEAGVINSYPDNMNKYHSMFWNLCNRDKDLLASIGAYFATKYDVSNITAYHGGFVRHQQSLACFAREWKTDISALELKAFAERAFGKMDFIEPDRRILHDEEFILQDRQDAYQSTPKAGISHQALEHVTVNCVYNRLLPFFDHVLVSTSRGPIITMRSFFEGISMTDMAAIGKPFHEDGDLFSIIPNASLLMYTSVNPENGEDTAIFRWRRLIYPKQGLDIADTGWEAITEQTKTREQLAQSPVELVFHHEAEAIQVQHDANNS